MKVQIKRIDENYLMEAQNESGNLLKMDASADIGGSESAFRPMQLLLAAIGGCSAIDVVLILKKQHQKITSFEVEVDGSREKIADYSLFRTVHLQFKIGGEVAADKAERAVALSLEKYCSVAKTLEPTASITHQITIIP